jgi:hypothetical protein
MLRVTHLGLLGTLAAMIAGLLGPGTGADASPPPAKVSFGTPGLFPTFGPEIHDYVVRCNDGPVTVTAHASGGWEAAIGNGAFRTGDFSEVVPLRTGRAIVITVREMGSPRLYRYHVRCLPDSFPTYTFTRSGPAWPKYFSVDVTHTLHRPEQRYAIIFDNHGVPVWWYHAPAGRPRVLPSGNVLWFDRSDSPHIWEIHRLDGSLVRTLDAVGHPANAHDLQLLGNGDHLVGAYVEQPHVDTSAYGGSSDASVVNTELQQVSPGGQLVWRWKSQNHISLDETGRHWPWVVDNPIPKGYDILHWNSVEPAGDSVIASFRHLDAVYKIRKSTRRLAWKLGGTRTPKSLRVRNDPDSYTFGGQHDAQLLPDGTLTVFDNRTGLGAPRAVRFAIDEKSRTATLLQSITDPDVAVSNCCGSARRLGNGHWLIAWGQNKPIGGYRPNGQRTFLLTYHSYFFSTRAEPVPAGLLSVRDLREGMDSMHPTP